MNVPFIDLQRVNAPHREAIREAIDRVIESGDFAGGRFVEAFEREFATWCGTQHAIGVSSGTDALVLALRALGVGPGDEVVTAPHTFFATASSIVHAGATPVFADVEPDTGSLSATAFERVVTRRTRAVIPVHLHGRPADMAAICEVASRHGVFVIEDACQAHGAEYRGRRAGSLGHAACFSFYPTKNLGALGDAGAVVTDDNGLAERVRMLREHGQSAKNRHAAIGWNARMDGIQAAVLQVKLPHLDAASSRRRAAAREYRRLLDGLPGVSLPADAEDDSSVHHLFAVRVGNRDAVAAAMARSGIGSGVHYPTPVHLQPAFEGLGHAAGDFPAAETFARETLSLPMHSELTPAEIAGSVTALEAAVCQPIAV